MDWLDGKKKFLLALALLLMGGIAMILKTITMEQFLDFATWVLGIYTAGNVGEHATKAIAAKKAPDVPVG